MKNSIMILPLAMLAVAAQAEPIVHGWVPSALIKQGHVQLVQSGESLRLDVLLHTHFMDRAVNSIISKERGNWPAGHPDAEAYIQHLQQARESVRQAKGRESLLIVFHLAPEPGDVSWFRGDVDDDASPWHMKNPQLLTRHEASRDYLTRNARLIVEDSLGIDPGTIAALAVLP